MGDLDIGKTLGVRSDRMRYGFIGLGNLGSPLAHNLFNAGFDLTVHDANPENARHHLSNGAAWAVLPGQLAGRCDAVITCLPSPVISERVLREIFSAMTPRSTWIEMSTLGRDEILRLAAIAKHHGIDTLELPVDWRCPFRGAWRDNASGRRRRRSHRAPPAGARCAWWKAVPHGAARFGGSDQGHHQHACFYPSGRRRRSADAGKARRLGPGASMGRDSGRVRATALSTKRKGSSSLTAATTSPSPWISH